MSSLRVLKREIDYTLEAFVFDCDMAVCYQPSKGDEVFALMQESVELRNSLYTKANNPAEPHNKHLVKRHYAALRAEIVGEFGSLFERLSSLIEG